MKGMLGYMSAGPRCTVIHILAMQKVIFPSMLLFATCGILVIKCFIFRISLMLVILPTMQTKVKTNWINRRVLIVFIQCKSPKRLREVILRIWISSESNARIFHRGHPDTLSNRSKLSSDF